MLWLLWNLLGNWTLNISRHFLLNIKILDGKKLFLWILCLEWNHKPMSNFIVPPLQQSSLPPLTAPDFQQEYPPEVHIKLKRQKKLKPLPGFFSMGEATSGREPSARCQGGWWSTPWGVLPSWTGTVFSLRFQYSIDYNTQNWQKLSFSWPEHGEQLQRIRLLLEHHQHWLDELLPLLDIPCWKYL